MNRKAWIVAALIGVLLLVCCVAVTCTPIGNAVGVTREDCDAGDRLEGDSDCKTSKTKKATKATKKPAKTTRR